MKCHLFYRLLCTLFSACIGLAGCGGGGDSADNTVASGCTSIAGSWAVVDSATATCSGSFGSGTTTQNANGNVTITQTGCNISFLSPANTVRTGTVSGNSVQFSGVLAIAGNNVTFTQNQINFTGAIAAGARKIDLTGTGAVTGSSQGVPGGCTTTSTETLTR